MKRVVILSDMHCGHKVGLTPPQWWYPENCNDDDAKISAIQRLLWEFYVQEIKALQPVDVLIVNGDAIDGSGDRSGGTELITTDRNKQVEMAVACLDEVNATKKIVIYGTPYHTGREEDWELVLSREIKADKIGSHEWVDVNGLVFDCKHKIGSSVIPHGRATAILRDVLWNELWSMKKSGQPNADVIIRSHVHYHVYTGTPRKLAMTTPAMQAYGTKFGARQCSGDIDIGFVHFDVENKENFTWMHNILDTEYLAASLFVA
jgi:hypothetical protein